MSAGEALRNEGTEQVLANEGVSVYRSSVESVLSDLIRSKKPFSVNHVHNRLRNMNVSGHHPNVIGAVFLSASRQGRMRRTGNMVKPNKATSHARPVAEWISVDALTTDDLTDLKRYRAALLQIVAINEKAKATAALPGNSRHQWHSGQLALAQEIDKVLDEA